MEDLTKLFEQDQEKAEIPANSEMLELSRLLKALAEGEKRVAEAEKKLKEETAAVKELSELIIPDYFDSLGLSGIKMEDGRSVTIERKFAATITEEKKAECLEWLRKNELASVIKHTVTASFGKGEDEEAQALVEELKSAGYAFEEKEGVHPQTLLSLVKEQMTGEKAQEFPQTLFNVFPIRRTKIK